MVNKDFYIAHQRQQSP